MLANDLAELDRAHLIHPVMSWRDHEARGPHVLTAGEGAYVTDAGGRTLLDGFAGLWCVNVGYGQRSVVEAATEQMMRLPYATGYFGYAAEPSIRLAARLAALAPGDLDHVFFTLGGSDAIDSALRFVRFYMHAKGTPERRHVIALQRGYHGSSTTGAGVTGLPAFHRDSDLPLPWQHHISNPYPYRNPVGTDPEAIIAASLAELRAKVEEVGADKVAAFFVEPITGSGGIIVPPRGWLPAMRQACRDLGILFIADEVITGFGRTGPLFACEDEAIVPDMMTIAKGLTSGYVPMGAVLMSDEVYRTIRDGSPEGATIGHGLTYSAHPVSAAVGLAVLDLYEGGLLAQGRRVGAYFAERLAGFADHPLVGETRGRGMLQGLELVTDKARRTKPDRALGVAGKLAAAGLENRLIFRAFADDMIGFAPPLCCTEADVDLIVERLGSTLDAVLADPAVRAALR
ncbi:aminotransferase class III-fold pyridoxal phosphate-dependent enzyme [Lichenibacterium dinghuense]|uniref:aminotransferase class III-fold pyridoxal phosphate-dependent enzyme n=1 Tax=Lichenibacterium dinghuense TaxID=2895977 RepID=UPI001F0154F6|nr:aminotransferase class III-fold pyridoxal phosphate-dependent enzyme [Lichenibacterium sp. 6Y81]